MKQLIALAGAVIVLLLAYVAAGPWLAIRGIHAAIEQRDTARLERYIDFPTLSSNFRARIEDRLARETGILGGGGIAGDLTRGLFHQISSTAVDGLLSPSGIAMLLEGRSLARRMTGANNGADIDADSDPNARNQRTAAGDLPLADARMRFESASRFTATTTATTGDGVTRDDTVFVFERQGLRWRLTDIRLPPM